MPKILLNVGDFDPNAAPAAGFGNYDGPVPPAGLYRTKAKLWRLKKANSGNLMIVVIFEIDESGDKKKFNGYPIWHNLVFTQKSSPFVNAALVAMGINPKALKEGVVTKPDKTTDIVSIGGVKVQGLPVLVTTKRETYEGTVKLSATSFAKAGAKEDSEEAAEEDIFGDDPFAGDDSTIGETEEAVNAGEADDPWAVDDGQSGEAY